MASRNWSILSIHIIFCSENPVERHIVSIQNMTQRIAHSFASDFGIFWSITRTMADFNGTLPPSLPPVQFWVSGCSPADTWIRFDLGVSSVRQFIDKFIQVVIPCLRMLQQTLRLVTDSLCKIPVSGFQRCPSLAVGDVWLQRDGDKWDNRMIIALSKLHQKFLTSSTNSNRCQVT